MGYLISLHDNEVDWNLLGIKVIGLVPTAADIPEGTYEYGDAYEVGTEPPYDLYIYTRPDGTVHTEGYWFPVGKFPMPGPQGPKGDGLEQIINAADGNIQSVRYDTVNGAQVDSTAVINYVNSTDGMPTSKSFYMISNMPIVPGKYVSMNATSDNKKIEVKVDDTALAQDYYKIDKSPSENGYYVPSYNPKTNKKAATIMTNNKIPNSICSRDNNGNCDFNKINLTEGITIGSYNYTNTVMTYGLKIDLTITDQTSGTLNANECNFIKWYVTCRPVINRKVYHRITPINSEQINIVKFMSCDDDGTILILTCDTSAKTYTISTLASQATDIYRHGIVMNDSDIVVKLDIYDNNSQNYTYEQLKMKLALNPAHCANVRIKRSDNTYYYSPATIFYWNDSTGNFNLSYNNTEGNKIDVNWTPSVVADNGTQIYNV